MESNRQIMLPRQHLLINLAPSIMVMPGASSYALVGESLSSQKLWQAVLAGQSPYLFTVMSDPGKQESPDKFYKTGVIAEAEAEGEGVDGAEADEGEEPPGQPADDFPF